VRHLESEPAMAPILQTLILLLTLFDGRRFSRQ